MSKLIALDDGHGMNTAGKRTPVMPNGQVIKENQFNKAVVDLLKVELERCGFSVVFTAIEIDDVALATRVKRANDAKADIFVSVHYNALDGKFDTNTGGVETYHYPGSVEGKKLATAVHKYLTQGTALKDRGVKSADFHVLRESKMPAVLVEAGFMDVRQEAALMLDPGYQLETAQEIAKGVCDYFGVSYKAANSTAKGTPIIGPATATVEQAQEWATQNGAPQEFIDLAPLYWELAPKRGGINPVVAYAQFAHETGWLYKIKSAAGLDASYKNPCGLKTTQGGGDYQASAHTRFSTWSEGITAQLDHLALYAGASGYPKAASPDPRHFGYIRGTATTVEALGGRWAPSPEYGNKLVKKMKELEQTQKKETSIAEDVNALLKAGVSLSSPEYWVLNAKPGQTVKGEYAAALIKAVVKTLKRG